MPVDAKGPSSLVDRVLETDRSIGRPEMAIGCSKRIHCPSETEFPAWYLYRIMLDCEYAQEAYSAGADD